MAPPSITAVVFPAGQTFEKVSLHPAKTLAAEYCLAVTVAVYLTITVTPVAAGVKCGSQPGSPFINRWSNLTVTFLKVGATFIYAFSKLGAVIE